MSKVQSPKLKGAIDSNDLIVVKLRFESSVSKPCVI